MEVMRSLPGRRILLETKESRTIWLREGDRNTKYFHVKTKQHRARNRIIKLLDSLGNWVETEDGIEKVATYYFADLFTASAPGDLEEAFRFITDITQITLRSKFTLSNKRFNCST